VGYGFGNRIAVGRRAITASPSFDPDALAYFSTAGITDSTAKTQINSFVVGIKDLGLWSNMVCWPLRSSQNASSGTTEYSLGGFGTYNGSLLGTALPIRNTEGINFLTGQTNSRILVSLPQINQPFSFYGCWFFSTATSSNEFLFSSVASSFSPFVKKEVIPASPYAIQMSAFPSSLYSTQKRAGQTRMFVSGSFNGASSSISIDGSSNSGSTGTGNTGASGINIGNGNTLTNANSNYEISFLMISTSALNDASIRALYKSTLGDGLGLP
jgi:hypothetical protein